MNTKHLVCVERSPVMGDNETQEEFQMRIFHFGDRLRNEIRLIENRRRIGKNASRRKAALEKRLVKLGEPN